MVLSVIYLIIIYKNIPEHVSFVLQVRTVKVGNVSLSASEQDIREFFSFSGDIEYIEMQRFVLLITVTHLLLQMLDFTSVLDELLLLSISGDERSQVAYVTFKKSDGAEMALLLSVRKMIFAYLFKQFLFFNN